MPTKREVTFEVRQVSSYFSGVPLDKVELSDKLKDDLGLNKTDLVYYTRALRAYANAHNAQARFPFSVPSKKDQTVSGVADELFTRISG
jgi:hypothetical protein